MKDLCGTNNIEKQHGHGLTSNVNPLNTLPEC